MHGHDKVIILDYGSQYTQLIARECARPVSIPRSTPAPSPLVSSRRSIPRR
jgi:hypothetical protein